MCQMCHLSPDGNWDGLKTPIDTELDEVGIENRWIEKCMNWDVSIES